MLIYEYLRVKSGIPSVYHDNTPAYNAVLRLLLLATIDKKKEENQNILE